MTEPLHVLYAALAGWRLAHMLFDEAGPLDMFGRLRAFFGLPDDPMLPHRPRWFVGDLLSCIYCLTVWTTGLFFVLGALVSWAIPAVGAAMAVAMVVQLAVKLAGEAGSWYRKGAG